MPDARPRRRYAVLRATFNDPITRALLDGAMRAFAQAGVATADIAVFEVPGAFELPVAARWLAQSKERFCAIVALGCVIRGETPHFEYVAGAAARGLGDVAVSTGVPIAFGVLTADTLAQAQARAADGAAAADSHAAESASAGASSNKGFEAAQAAMQMAHLRERLTDRPR